MDIVKNIGIITSISWNSNQWKDEPIELDLEKSKYGHVIENHFMLEALNFGFDKYPCESDNTYIAYTPMFNTLPTSENSKNVDIVFFISTDYNDNRRKIVGCYGFPEIGNFKRNAQHPLFNEYKWGNVKSNINDIILFNNYIVINKININSRKLIPSDKEISNRKFNYFNSENLLNLFEIALKRNMQNQNLFSLIRRIIKKNNLIDFINKSNNEYLKKLINTLDIPNFKENNEYDETFIDEKTKREIINRIESENVDALDDIIKNELKYQNEKPNVKAILSKRIERGNFANKIKQINNYKCLICERLNQTPYSFKKKTNGEYYVEVHHVIPVSKLIIGTLSSANLITVCANHHRQLHYGNAELIEVNDNRFLFKIDGKLIIVNKSKYLISNTITND